MRPDFNRIADSYAAQRAHPAAVSSQIGQALAGLVQPGRPILELGVGTGRIALPTVAAGRAVVGIDIAHDMLLVASEMDNPPSRLKLVEGDITALPFANGCFNAVTAVHVLHLVRDVEAVLRESVRVLTPGGLFIQGRDWLDPASCAAQLRMQLRYAVMALSPNARPPSAMVDIPALLHAMGGTATDETIAAEWQTTASPAQIIEGMATRADNETWALPDELLNGAVAQVHRWAAETWDNLDEEQPVLRRFLLTTTKIEN